MKKIILSVCLFSSVSASANIYNAFKDIAMIKKGPKSCVLNIGSADQYIRLSCDGNSSIAINRMTAEPNETLSLYSGQLQDALPGYKMTVVHSGLLMFTK